MVQMFTRTVYDEIAGRRVTATAEESVDVITDALLTASRFGSHLFSQ